MLALHVTHSHRYGYASLLHIVKRSLLCTMDGLTLTAASFKSTPSVCTHARAF